MLIQLLVNALAFYVTSYIVPGFTIAGWQPLIVISIVWGLLSLLIKPVLVILTLPINILTLGLFTLVINALLLLITSRIVPGFFLNGFGAAFWGAIVLSLINMFLSKLIR